jgi:hypothetical protein
VLSKERGCGIAPPVMTGAPGLTECAGDEVELFDMAVDWYPPKSPERLRLVSPPVVMVCSGSRGTADADRAWGLEHRVGGALWER